MFSFKFLAWFILGIVILVAGASLIINISTEAGHESTSVNVTQTNSSDEHKTVQDVAVKGEFPVWPFVFEGVLLAFAGYMFTKNWKAAGWIAVIIIVSFPLLYIGVGWPQFLPTLLGVSLVGLSLYLFTQKSGAKFAGLLILVATTFMFMLHLHWLDPFTNVLDEIVTESSTEKKIERRSLFDASESEQSVAPKASSGPVGGVLVPGKIQEIKVKKNCTTLVAEKIFTPRRETFLNQPLLATVEPGEYLVTAEGSRLQPFFGNGGESPTYSRVIDTEGNLLDNSNGEITQFIVTGDQKLFMLFPEKPYGMFLINTGIHKYAAGKSYFFSTKTSVPIKMDLNVYQRAKSHTGTGSFSVKLYRCRK